MNPFHPSSARIAGRFVVLSAPVRGGGSDVYRARDELSGATVALKVLRELGPAGAARLEREARLLGAHAHAALPRYVWHGADERGTPCLAVEWIDGPNLGQRLAEGPLSVDETLLLGRALAKTLGFLHARGLVHRDVKPGNVLLPAGELADAHLIDLGIARADGETTEWTRAGEPLGTPGYMAPEQARGRLDVDARADVFGLGAVLFKCLTGRAPFVGETITATLAKLLFERAPRASSLAVGVPPWLDARIDTMLDKDRERRPRDGAAVLDLLAAGPTDTRIAGPDVGATRPVASVRPPVALTSGERRVVGVLVACVGAEPLWADDPTHSVVATGGVADLSVLRRGEALCAAHGAHVEVLASGVLVAALDQEGSADERAAAAARCAFALESELGPVPLALATGLGLIDDGELLGDAIDRAAALLAAHPAARRDDAPPSSAVPPPPRALLVDDTTAGLLGHRFTIRRTLEGAWLSNEPPPEGDRRGSPFVGRRRELGILTGELDACVVGRSARAVPVLGAAGVGKTRLAHEIRGSLRGDVVVWRATSEVMGRGASLGLVTDALRDGLLDRAPASSAEAGRALRERVARHLAPADVDRVAGFLGELVGVGAVVEPSDAATQLRAARQDPTLMADQLRRAFEDLLLAECSAHPVVLLLDDLHRADAASAKLVDAALRRLRDRPFFVLGLARPEVRERLPQAIGWRGVTTIELGQLSSDESRSLVRHRLGASAAEALVDYVVRCGDGNAFFLEEFLRVTRSPEKRAARSSEAPPSSAALPAAPETVLTMIRSEIEGLPALARQALRGASVYGATFSNPAVAQLLGGRGGPSDAAIREALESLCEHELVEPGGRPFHDGSPAYVFRHDLVREAVVGTLTEADARLGHRLAGAYLADLPGVSASVVAEHFHRGGELERAAERLVHAGQQALEVNDLDAAISLARRAVEVGAHGALLGRARLVLAEAHRWQGDQGAAARDAAAALELLPEELPAWSRAAGELATAFGKLGEKDALAALTARLLGRLSDRASGQLVVATSRAITQLYFAGRHASASAALERLETTPAELLEAEPLADARLSGALSVRALFDRRIDVHLGLVRRARDAFARAGDLRDACLYDLAIGHASSELGLYEEAERVLREALATARALGVPYLVPLAALNLGLALAHLEREGALAEAESLEKQVARETDPRNDARAHCAAHAYLAFVLERAGRLEEAETAARRAVELAGTASTLTAPAAAVLADVLLAQGRAADALAVTGPAHAGMLSQTRVEEGEASLRIAHVLALDGVGKSREAKDLLAAARARLLDDARRIADPELAASFLERVPEHRRILELGRAWAVE